jgi:hypothetical protein
MNHIDSDTLDECRDALLYGRPLEQLAQCIKCSPQELAQLLRLNPRVNAAEKQHAEEIDLWAMDRLYAIL